jgi:hypothetical protein
MQVEPRAVPGEPGSVAGFRDYGPYCGVTASGKSLHAVVAQVSVPKPVLAKMLAALDGTAARAPACGLSEWQREWLMATLRLPGKEVSGFQNASKYPTGAQRREQPAERQ